MSLMPHMNYPAICAMHDTWSKVIILDCVSCGKRTKSKLSHDLTDQQILKSDEFDGWTAKGVFGAKRTRCPNCRKNNIN